MAQNKLFTVKYHGVTLNVTKALAEQVREWKEEENPRPRKVVRETYWTVEDLARRMRRHHSEG